MPTPEKLAAVATATDELADVIDTYVAACRDELAAAAAYTDARELKISTYNAIDPARRRLLDAAQAGTPPVPPLT